MNRYDKIIEILKSEVIPALGCTEPIALALAVAKAKEMLKGEFKYLTAKVSPNIYKNGMGVGVPGTGMVGLSIAAALGAICGKSVYKLEVLNDVNPEYLAQAKKMIADGKITVEPFDTTQKLYISASCTDGENVSEAIIEDSHANITKVYLNGKLVESKCDLSSDSCVTDDDFILEYDDIYSFVKEIPLSEIEFILEGAKLNSELSDLGLKERSGLGVGANIASKIPDFDNKNDIMRIAMARTAAASDARMSGAMKPAMSTAGSGNQGITAMMPIVSAAKTLESSREELIRALVLSNLTVIYMKKFFGRLSAACGCVIASTGAACGVTYLMGGNKDQIEFSIKNMIGNLTGMICDGAKLGCALKVATGTSAAIQSASLAMDNICISGNDGIVENGTDRTIRNIGKIANEAMDKVDGAILDIMVNKHN